MKLAVSNRLKRKFPDIKEVIVEETDEDREETDSDSEGADEDGEGDLKGPPQMESLGEPGKPGKGTPEQGAMQDSDRTSHTDAQQERTLTIIDMNVKDIEDISGTLQTLNQDEKERKNVHHPSDIFTPDNEENADISWAQKQVPKNPEQLKLKEEFQEGGIWDLKQEPEEKTGPAERSRKQRAIIDGRWSS